MEQIIEILMNRDGLTRCEAEEAIQDVQEMMQECEYDPEQCEQIFLEEIGLEMDYLPDFLYN